MKHFFSIDFMELTNKFWSAFIEILPKIVTAMLALIIGWFLGHIVGFVISSAIRRSGLDDTWAKTTLGKGLKQSGISLCRIAEFISRWSIYLISIYVAIEFLNIEALKLFMSSVIGYIPYFIGGIVIFVAGFLVVEFMANVVSGIVKDLGYKYSTIAGHLLRILGFLIVIITALTIMKIDVFVLNLFIIAVAFGISVGIALALGISFGLGLKDIVAKNAERWFISLKLGIDKFQEDITIKSLQERIKELEEKIKEYELKLQSIEKVKKFKLEGLKMPIEDLTSWLNETVNEKGQVSEVYGGYKIVVLDEIDFPWHEILLALTYHGYEVWLSREKDKIIIQGSLRTE
ncbi:MAG: hypothetical protein N3F64_07340 [Nitrososphaeria archaeon]|nr:hypothetical protein [Nitrososphaeria archaeon]